MDGDPSIEQQVMHRYPKDEKERKCNPHRQRMEALRDAYRQRLNQEYEKETIQKANEAAR